MTKHMLEGTQRKRKIFLSDSNVFLFRLEGEGRWGGGRKRRVCNVLL